jgi:hypothetical protein
MEGRYTFIAIHLKRGIWQILLEGSLACDRSHGRYKYTCMDTWPAWARKRHVRIYLPTISLYVHTWHTPCASMLRRWRSTPSQRKLHVNRPMDRPMPWICPNRLIGPCLEFQQFMVLAYVPLRVSRPPCLLSPSFPAASPARGEWGMEAGFV